MNAKLSHFESFQHHLNVLQEEKVLNERIIKTLEIIANYNDKVKYCRKLLKTKDSLIEALKSKKKKKNLAYDIPYCLNNIDILEKKGIFKKV